jgi:hypothetical protein
VGTNPLEWSWDERNSASSCRPSSSIDGDDKDDSGGEELLPLERNRLAASSSTLRR